MNGFGKWFFASVVVGCASFLAYKAPEVMNGAYVTVMMVVGVVLLCVDE